MCQHQTVLDVSQGRDCCEVRERGSRTATREEPGLLYQVLKRGFVGPVVLSIYRPRVLGRENVPKSGPVIFVPNHLSFCDSVFLPLSLKRQLTYLAKSDYFTGTGVKGGLSRAFFSGIGMEPIDRSGGAASASALDKAREILAEGRQLGMYIEGTRSPDGRLYRGKTGVARLALATGATVVPVGMSGTDKVQPLGQTMPRWAKVTVEFGRPRTYGPVAPDQEREEARRVTDEIMLDIQKMTGQEYVDEYAADVKKRMKDLRDSGEGQASAA